MEDSNAAAALNPDEVVTEFYRLQTGEGAEPEEIRAHVRELIVKSFPDEPWDGKLEDGQPVVLAVLSDRVVVRHKSAVQEKVEALLSDSGLAFSEPSKGAHGCGGGGAGGGARNEAASSGENSGAQVATEGGGFFNPRPAE
jgi:hypothetical protein